MAATIDINRKRGDTRRISFEIISEGVAVDISTWTSFLLTVDPSKAPDDDTTKLEQMNGVISNGPSGRVHFVPSGTIAVGKWFYDCQAIDDNGEKVTFAEGKYNVTQDITK